MPRSSFPAQCLPPSLHNSRERPLHISTTKSHARRWRCGGLASVVCAHRASFSNVLGAHRATTTLNTDRPPLSSQARPGRCCTYQACYNLPGSPATRNERGSNDFFEGPEQERCWFQKASESGVHCRQSQPSPPQCATENQDMQHRTLDYTTLVPVFLPFHSLIIPLLRRPRQA